MCGLVAGGWNNTSMLKILILFSKMWAELLSAFTHKEQLNFIIISETESFVVSSGLWWQFLLLLLKRPTIYAAVTLLLLLHYSQRKTACFSNMHNSRSKCQCTWLLQGMGDDTLIGWIMLCPKPTYDSLRDFIQPLCPLSLTWCQDFVPFNFKWSWTRP